MAAASRHCKKSRTPMGPLPLHQRPSAKGHVVHQLWFQGIQLLSIEKNPRRRHHISFKIPLPGESHSLQKPTHWFSLFEFCDSHPFHMYTITCAILPHRMLWQFQTLIIFPHFSIKRKYRIFIQYLSAARAQSLLPHLSLYHWQIRWEDYASVGDWKVFYLTDWSYRIWCSN